MGYVFFDVLITEGGVASNKVKGKVNLRTFPTSNLRSGELKSKVSPTQLRKFIGGKGISSQNRAVLRLNFSISQVIH